MKNRKTILVQVGVIAVIVSTLISLINGFFIYQNGREEYINMLQDHTEDILEQTRSEMKAYASFPWLLQYWETKGSDMELSGDGSARDRELIRIDSELGEESADKITEQQAESLSETDQRLLAEFCYLKITDIYNKIRLNFELEKLYCCYINEAGGHMPVFNSLSEEDAAAGKNNTALGEAWEFDLSLHPSIKEMLENPEDRAFLETVTNSMDGREYLYGYIPVMVEGRLKCYICAAYTTDQVNAGILREIMDFEWTNLVMMVLGTIILMLLINRVVLRNISAVQKALKQYRQDKDSDTAAENLRKIRTGNEIGRLADDLALTIEELRLYYMQMTKLAAEKERTDTELSLASKIQREALISKFPPYPDRTEFDIYASMDPAREVGGDFYDFFLVDNDHLCMVIADVSEKGMPAALFMMEAKSTVAHNARTGRTPAQIITDSNAELCENNEESMFVTVWLGILEISTGIITAVNAGHEYPAVRTPGGSFSLIKDKHGRMLGVTEELKVFEYEMRLEPGSQLFVYTDGVTEAASVSQELFGTGRMIDALNHDNTADIRENLSNVRSAIDGFTAGAEQFDDITMMCLEYIGPVCE